tara:strand:+ start:208 stop:480 length:273 start_codon:yes stop_codon:yes gene_type:complete
MTDYLLTSEFEAPIRYNAVCDQFEKTRKTKYPWSEMKVGQSFYVILNRKTMVQLQNNLSGCARSWAKRNGLDWDFATQQVEGGVRIWRIK